MSAADGGSPDPGLVAGTLRGYRSWHLLRHPDDAPVGALPLTSITRPRVVWGPTMRAACTPVGPADHLAAAHRSPEGDCTCGIYAWHAPGFVDEYASEVFGAVEASGRVLMGTRGFRAEQTRVVALVTRNRRLADAGRAAGIAVYRSRRKLLADFPPEDAWSLVGEEPPRVRRWGARPLALAMVASVASRAIVVLGAMAAAPAALLLGGLLLSELAVLTVVVRSQRP